MTNVIKQLTDGNPQSAVTVSLQSHALCIVIARMENTFVHLGFSFAVAIFNGVWARLNGIVTQALCLPPQNLLLFQCGANALEAQNKPFSFPASTTSRIVASLRSLRQRHHHLPLLPSTDTMGLFCSSHPRAYTDDVEKIPIIHVHTCRLKLTHWWPLDLNTQDEVKFRGELERHSSKVVLTCDTCFMVLCSQCQGNEGDVETVQHESCGGMTAHTVW